MLVHCFFAALKTVERATCSYGTERDKKHDDGYDMHKKVQQVKSKSEINASRLLINTDCTLLIYLYPDAWC